MVRGLGPGLKGRDAKRDGNMEVEEVKSGDRPTASSPSLVSMSLALSLSRSLESLV